MRKTSLATEDLPAIKELSFQSGKVGILVPELVKQSVGSLVVEML